MDHEGIIVTTDSAEDDEQAQAWCLTRVGKNSDWLRLFEHTEISIGRGLNVTYQLISASCPLMISRLHCTFQQREDGQWIVTDRKSLNGVWVNGKRIPAEKPHCLKLGDSIKLGVPITGTRVEYEYILVRQPIKDLKHYLAKGHSEGTCTASVPKKTKRKWSTDEVEPSTSSKPKLYRSSASDKSLAQPCPTTEQHGPSPQQPEDTGPSTHAHGVDPPPEASSCPIDRDNLQRYSQNILTLRERVDDTRRQVAALEGEPQQGDPLREEQVRDLQSQLETLRAKMHRMETLEKSFSETEKQLEVQKTQQQEERLKKQLEEALQEQKKVMEELALSRKGFEEVLLAKDIELEVTKEEEKKARAQKDEVVTQMHEVLENELQCIICSELFIAAVTLNCAHSFCLHCIREWRRRKDECPICRQDILSQTRSLVLDNCIDRMVENLSVEMKERRKTLITERKAAKPEEVMVIHDEDSSSDSSSSSSVFSRGGRYSYEESLESDVHWDSTPFNSSDSDEDVMEV